MSEMTEKGVTNRGPKKRDPACFQTMHAILIPAGTVLRQDPGKPGVFSCPVAFGKFIIETSPAQTHPDTYKRVISA
jgi:hypothetical protein